VVEDCLSLLLDVDDIDRMWTATDAHKDNKAALRHRRALLLEVRPTLEPTSAHSELKIAL
jgi:hypothetical protein